MMDVEGGLAGADESFAMSVKELTTLMELRGHEAQGKITQTYGDVSEICRRLRTSQNHGKAISCAFEASQSNWRLRSVDCGSLVFLSVALLLAF